MHVYFRGTIKGRTFKKVHENISVNRKAVFFVGRKRGTPNTAGKECTARHSTHLPNTRPQLKLYLRISIYWHIPPCLAKLPSRKGWRYPDEVRQHSTVPHSNTGRQGSDIATILNFKRIAMGVLHRVWTRCPNRMASLCRPAYNLLWYFNSCSAHYLSYLVHYCRPERLMFAKKTIPYHTNEM